MCLGPVKVGGGGQTITGKCVAFPLFDELWGKFKKLGVKLTKDLRRDWRDFKGIG